MADSNITKKALASALKSMMETMPFDKISVSDICEKCEMNRKSFYYHFKDKYDLVNWIFDTEFIAAVHQKEYDTAWELLEDICHYFYENRTFYRRALNVHGQNSFAEHFRDLLLPVITSRIQGSFMTERATDFQINFFSDALILGFQRWLTEREPMPPDEFIENSKICLCLISERIDKLKDEIKG